MSNELPNTNEYRLDPAFNKNLVLAYQPVPEINVSELPSLADNWLDHLQKIICEADSKLASNCLTVHLNKASKYGAKKSLRDQLQLIYHRLQGNLDSELGELLLNNRQALICKLTEEIIHCSEGFHNRVNIIVGSFYKPRNLSELLGVVRKGLVEEAATRLTKEVHAWNRVSIIAAGDGLGIKANLHEDPYGGALSENTIRQALKQIFLKKFTPFNLPCLLISTFMEFVPEFEIEKHNENGICLQTQKKITTLIKRFLPDFICETPNHPNHWITYFKVSRDKENPFVFSLVDLNWVKFYQSFFYAMSVQNESKTNDIYFENPQINTLFDSGCYNLFLRKKTSRNPTKLIYRLFKQARYGDLLEQLVELNTRFPNYYKKINNNAIPNQNCLGFLDLLTIKLEGDQENPEEILQGFHLILRLDLERKTTVIGMIAKTLLLQNKPGINLLMLAAQHNPMVINDILFFLKAHKEVIDAKLIEQMFLMKNKDNLNALMVATLHHSDAVEMILNFISENINYLDNNLLQKFFLEKQTNNCNVLMLAASKQTEAIGTILSFLTTHIGRFANETLRNIFTQQQTDRYTAITLTARDHPDQVKSILSFITDHIKIDGETIRKLLFNENSKNVCTALMLAVKNQADAAFSILKFISNNIEIFDHTILEKIFLEKDQDGFTILMLASRYQPRALEALLDFIHAKNEFIANKKNNFFPPRNLPALFTEKNSSDYNCLMLAAEYQPISVPVILNFIKNNADFKPSIENLLFTKNQKGCNSLLLARHHPVALLLIINFIRAQSKAVISVTLEEIFLEKHQSGLNFLMYLARDKALSLKSIFDFFEQHPKFITQKNLQTLITEKNEWQYNCLMLAARNQYDAVAHILNFIHHHPEVFSTQYINQLFLEQDKNGISTLMIASEYQPKIVKLFLNFIQDQPKVFSSTFLNQFLVAHDRYRCNALMVAATHHASVVGLLLTFLTNNIKQISRDTLLNFVFKSIHDKDAANAVFFGGRYDYRKTVLSVTARLEDRTAIHALLEFIDKHIELLGIEIFADLLREKDNKENYIFRPACSEYPFPMKKVLSFIAHSVKNEEFIPIQDVSAYFIFEQFARWTIASNQDQKLFNKVIKNCSALLLLHFNKDYFAEQPKNLKLVTDKLFDCYLEELVERQSKKIIYTTKFTFFGWRYSTTDKMIASLALKEVLEKSELDKGPALMRLKQYYPALSNSRLGNLFAAYQEIDTLKPEDADELGLENDLENDQVHFKTAKLA